MTFLTRREPRTLSDEAPTGWRADALHIGNGAQALEVAVFSSPRQPTDAELRGLHDKRKRGRAAPVVISVLWGSDRAALGWHDGAEELLRADLERSQVERLCNAALDAPDRHAAHRFLAHALSQLASPIPGLKNSGLFAIHELKEGVPRRDDWAAEQQRATALLSLRGRELITRLGFGIERIDGPASVLVAAGTKVAVAVFLERAEQIEPASPQFNQLSPVSYALAKADTENLDYVVVSAGSALRVYPVRPGIGTGRRGRTETYVELDLAVLPNEHAGYLTLLASADALKPNGTLVEVLNQSRDYAVGLGERLRERVYSEVVPQLAKAIVKARRLRNPTTEALAETYEMALLVLFRLLFVAYAEDKELLPLHSSASYQRNSLKEIAKLLADEHTRAARYGNADSYWSKVVQLWKAVESGNSAWGVPAYDGGLFASGESAAESARALALLTLPDETFAPALRALLLDEAEGTLGPIDFRSLGVREFGTIYEGLLEQELSVAEQDLAVQNEAYVPARRNASVVVREGEVYLHTASGARKSTGSYYTPEFAVEHLLDHALEPALADHLNRLDAVYTVDPRKAAEQFFDFHVADIAMGSGHFLVAAIDRIERKLSGYLAKRPLAGVRDELERLRATAKDALGKDYAGEEIEDTQLLRRQIARRCIHGVDLNPVAVELARLSIWIHTFVPGLPLSFLDANLIVGNSLVGIATLDEVRDLTSEGGIQISLLDDWTERWLAAARPHLDKLAKVAEATLAEVRDARKAYEAARKAIHATEEYLTILAASRIDDEIAGVVQSGALTEYKAAQRDVFSGGLLTKAEKALAGLRALHFPTAFPQVFLGRRAGFDVIIGNPPWEKAHVEEHEFWARYYPGFRGLTQSERERRWPAMRRARPDLKRAFEREREQSDALRDLLLRGPYPGMGSGHPDLYKAFCWRFWNLINRDGGSMGVVLPRAVFAAKGSEEFRKAVFGDTGESDITTLVNRGQWVFEMEPRYSIALTVIRRQREREGGAVYLRGPYSRRAEFESRIAEPPAEFTYAAVRQLNETIALPLLPNKEAGQVFQKMRRHPSFGDEHAREWRARPMQGDINATTGQQWMTFDAAPSARRWPVYAGESFDLWTPDTGSYYAVADATALREHLQAKRENSANNRRSAFSEFPAPWIGDPKTLPCRHARIAFRDVTRATDSRTVRTALVPPNVFLTHKAPFLLWPRSQPKHHALVLGVMSSIPFDWYARRFVEVTLSFELLGGFPVPQDDASAEATRVVTLAARLTSVDERFEEWAAQFNLEPQELAADERDDHINELDATVAHLYGLDEHDVAHIFETFHDGWDYEERLRATLRHYRRLASASR